AGYLRKNGADTEYAIVAHYNTDGSFDTSFGTGGIVETTFATYERVHSMSLQSDGKIVVFGDYNDGIFTRRFNADGSIDTTFGTNGLVTDFNGTSAGGSSVAIQSDGKIDVTGNRDNRTFVIRYNSDGTHDNGFGSGGQVLNPFATNDNADSANTLLIQSDGKIVTGGNANTGTKNDLALGRLNTDGTLDTSFGSNGSLFTSVTTGSDSGIASLAIQADGKIVGAGGAYNGSYYDWALVRYADI